MCSQSGDEREKKRITTNQYSTKDRTAEIGAQLTLWLSGRGS
jgi:hypothetical protein